jgi:hypothetical protein
LVIALDVKCSVEGINRFAVSPEGYEGVSLIVCVFEILLSVFALSGDSTKLGERFIVPPGFK